MRRRLLAAVGCVAVSVLCVWVVDPDSRNAASLLQGAAWGAAGVLVVGLVLAVARRRSAAGDRDPAQ